MTSSGDAASVGGEPSQPEDLELPEIFKRYKDRWVAIIVTKRDKNLQPIRGRVVANEGDRYRLRQAIASHREICILYAGEPAYPLLL